MTYTSCACSIGNSEFAFGVHDVERSVWRQKYLVEIYPTCQKNNKEIVNDNENSNNERENIYTVCVRDTEGERCGEDPHPAYSMESVSFSKIGSRRPDVGPDRLLGSPPTGGHASFAETPAPPAWPS